VSFKESLLSPGRAEKFDVDDLPGYLIRHPEKSLADRISIVRLLCSTATPILLLKYQLAGIARTVNQCMIQNPSCIFFSKFQSAFHRALTLRCPWGRTSGKLLPAFIWVTGLSFTDSGPCKSKGQYANVERGYSQIEWAS
jgi:hypothetical protein